MNGFHWQDHISIDPNIQQGTPCLRGTRTPVYVILEALAVNMSVDEVLKEFSPITPKHIQACIFYAALLADERELAGQI